MAHDSRLSKHSRSFMSSCRCAEEGWTTEQAALEATGLLRGRLPTVTRSHWLFVLWVLVTACRCSYSSWTTGKSKGVILTHRR
ncbi:hypothetical protein L3X38_005295 [Prunus dulcis]|uniref:Uncharacterized protein n=1 Tax=Prunus dulcis TaxID=3755 RepID=A0AAD4ZQM8_PRUDU|nr:hypothetical protein L3X38_005295 [Prunus dulcis]